jgi:hypothetical protein
VILLLKGLSEDACLIRCGNNCYVGCLDAITHNMGVVHEHLGRSLSMRDAYDSSISATSMMRLVYRHVIKNRGLCIEQYCNKNVEVSKEVYEAENKPETQTPS